MSVSAHDGVSFTLVQPTIFRGVNTPNGNVGDLWVDTTGGTPIVKKCTVAPTTWVSIEGGGGGGGTWGSITGTLSAQTDLQNALDLKADISSLATVATTGAYSDLTGLPTIPAQFNPIAGTNMTITGTYPNITFDAAGGGGSSWTFGTSTIDFGTFPGANEASVAVTGQTSILSTSTPLAWVSADATDNAGDPYWTSVSTLLNFNASLVDIAPTPKTYTAAGSAAIDNVVFKFGGGSLSLNGTTDWITTPNNADFDFGTGDFTIEFHSRKTADAPGSFDAVMATDTTTSGTDGFFIELSASRGFGFGYASAFSGYSMNPNDSTWHHYAMSRVGGSLRLFLDGVLVATFANSDNITSTNQFCIGNLAAPALPYAGWLDNIRITKGVGRYTATFTPPTTEYLTASGAGAHTAGDHRYMSLLSDLTCSVPIAGTGFTIYARSLEKLQGQFTLNWGWSD